MDALSPFGIRHLDMPLTPQKVWAGDQGGVHVVWRVIETPSPTLPTREIPRS